MELLANVPLTDTPGTVVAKQSDHKAGSISTELTRSMIEELRRVIEKEMRRFQVRSSDREDIIQTVLEKLVSKLRTNFDATKSDTLMPYAATAAKDLARSASLRQRRHTNRFSSSEYEPEFTESSDPAPEDLAVVRTLLAVRFAPGNSQDTIPDAVVDLLAEGVGGQRLDRRRRHRARDEMGGLVAAVLP